VPGDENPKGSTERSAKRAVEKGRAQRGCEAPVQRTANPPLSAIFEIKRNQRMGC